MKISLYIVVIAGLTRNLLFRRYRTLKPTEHGMTPYCYCGRVA